MPTETAGMAGDASLSLPCPPAISVERTLAIIKPDAIDRAEEIVEHIKEYGFTILQQRRLRLSPEQAADFYAEHYGKMFFPSLIAYMHSNDILILVLAKLDAVAEWRRIIGPTDARRAKEEAPESLRAIYGHDQTRNALHGSDSTFSAEREIKYMFPESAALFDPAPHTQTANDYLKKAVNPTLLKGLTELCKQKPEDPLEWLANWLLANNPNKPKIELAN